MEGSYAMCAIGSFKTTVMARLLFLISLQLYDLYMPL